MNIIFNTGSALINGIAIQGLTPLQTVELLPSHVAYLGSAYFTSAQVKGLTSRELFDLAEARFVNAQVAALSSTQVRALAQADFTSRQVFDYAVEPGGPLAMELNGAERPGGGPRWDDDVAQGSGATFSAYLSSAQVANLADSHFSASQVVEVFPRDAFAAINRYEERYGWNMTSVGADSLRRSPDVTFLMAVNGSTQHYHSAAWVAWHDVYDAFPRRYDAAGLAIDDYGYFDSERYYIENRDYGVLRGGRFGRDVMLPEDREKMFRAYSQGDWLWANAGFRDMAGANTNSTSGYGYVMNARQRRSWRFAFFGGTLADGGSLSERALRYGDDSGIMDFTARNVGFLGS
jgi:hypothetical protein